MDNEIRKYCESCKFYSVLGCQSTLICTNGNKFLAADVQPIRRGHWYDNTYRYVGELDAYFIQACCSCCNRYSDKLDQYTKIMSNETCSHCGADMREPEAIKR